MRRLLRFLPMAVFVGLACAIAPGGVARAAAGGDCRQAALQRLRAASPDGFEIYRRTSEPAFFMGWIDCGDAQYDLPTAVHESTHFVSGETDAFPLVGGGSVERPHAVSAFFPPYRIAGRFKSDGFTAIYLRRGRASSATDPLYLLDELNAYSHDLRAAVDLKAMRQAGETVDHRDGLAALMAFVAVYADVARASEPETWAGLRQPDTKAAIATLWRRAEGVMAASCGIPDFGSDDKRYIAQVCDLGSQSALSSLLDRPQACPAACLEPEPEVGLTSDGDPPVEEVPETDRPRHPFNVRFGPRRHRLSARAN